MATAKGTDEKKDKTENSGADMTTTPGDDEAKALFDQPLVLEGKRKRKSTELFSFREKARRKSVDYAGGKGIRLGDIPYIESNIAKTKSEKLRFLFKICYDRTGTRIEIKRSLRDFSGFSDEDIAEKKQSSLEKTTLAGLKPLCDFLGLDTNGNKGDIITRIVEFLTKPHDHGKEPKKRRRSSTGAGRPRKKSKASETDEEKDDDLEDDAIGDNEQEEKSFEDLENSEMDVSQATDDNDKTSDDVAAKEDKKEKDTEPSKDESTVKNSDKNPAEEKTEASPTNQSKELENED